MKIRSILAAALLAIGSTAGVYISASPASAAPPCVAEWDVVVGGLNDNQSTIFTGSVDQRVGYNSYDTRSGVNELKRLVLQHRQQCPGSWISMYGYSGGAAVVNVGARELKNIGRINAVLLADPKQAPEQGIGPGFAATDFPFRFMPTLGGWNNDFGGIPTFRDCVRADHICNSQASMGGYPAEHGKYAFNVDLYSNTGNSLRVR